MRNITLVLAIAIPTLSVGTAAAQDNAAVVETTTTTTPAPGPGSVEFGLFTGGFISNYYHQFFSYEYVYRRQELNQLSPLFGARLAVFPSRYFGIEVEGSVIHAETKETSHNVTIFGLLGQLMLQRPGRFTPFIAAGVSSRMVISNLHGDDTDRPVHVGAGFRIFATSTVAIRLDGRFLRGPSSKDPYAFDASYGELMVGLSFNPSSSTSETTVTVADQDPDRDGVLGRNDACPTEAGTNPDGCPNRDTDADGIMDAADKCPNEAETVNAFQDEDGCPDTLPDTDADGLDDTKDKCPAEAEDKDGFQDEDGCPDPDNDGDGSMDGVDKCPAEAGPVENAGCPDADADGDGVVDRLDNCPQEAGAKDNQGCKKKQLVVITKDQLKILDQVYFKTNSAKLDKKSNKLLDNMAFVLKAHPEIVKVRIEGHTDDVGNDAKNLTLSQQRAESVVAYLVAAGVDATRFEAVGFGESKPLVEGKTKKARTANRRVEFNVVSQ